MAAVLIVTQSEDESADAVIAELQTRDTSVFRLDLADFPQRIAFSAQPSESGEWCGRVAHEDGWSVDLAEISAVYYRRPTDFGGNDLRSTGERKFIKAESRMGFGGVLMSLDALYVNNPFRIADAEFKPYQLKVASQSGLRVPATLITNDGARALAYSEHFHSANGCGVIYKPMASGFIRNDRDELRQIFATPVVISPDDAASLATTAHTLQARVDKRLDVRVTTVGATHYGVAIESASRAGRTDWRADYNSLSYSPIDVPPDVAEPLNEYLAVMGLSYGASDLSVDYDGRWWFLECNPNGQWGFVASTSGQPIATAIAELLISGG